MLTVSSWKFASVVKLKINSFRYVPLKGKFYIKQPAKLANKKAFINMKDEDDQCFKWTVTRALNPVDRDGGTNHKSVEGASRKAQLEWNRVPSRLERHRQVWEKYYMSVKYLGMKWMCTLWEFHPSSVKRCRFQTVKSSIIVFSRVWVGYCLCRFQIRNRRGDIFAEGVWTTMILNITKNTATIMRQ